MLRTARIPLFLTLLAFALLLGTASFAGPPTPVCGNGDLEEGEECDDGNNVSGDGCSATCQLEVCGNDRVDFDEECDGTADSACPGECELDCTCFVPPDPFCGDNVVNQASEECDGTDDQACPGDCLSDCTCDSPPEPFCGDNVVNQASEECDGSDDAQCPGLCQGDCLCGEDVPVCGDGDVEGDEECDPPDGVFCDDNCQEIPLVCGNFIVQPPEECDDGNTVDGDGCSANCTIERGEGEQDEDQQACINNMNKAGENVSETASKAVVKCEKDPENCDEGEEKLAKAFARTENTEEKKCDPENLPDFAFTGAEQVNEAAAFATLGLFEHLFANGELGDDAKTCQVRVAKTTGEVLHKAYRKGNKAKRASLAAGASSALELQLDIVEGTVASGKLRSGAEHNLLKTISKKCKGVDLGEVVPGCLRLEPVARGTITPPLGASAVASCIVDASLCSYCQAINAMDALTIDCELYDDGKDNGSCGGLVD